MYALPTLGFKFNFGRSAIAFSPSFQAGLGLRLSTLDNIKNLINKVDILKDPLKDVSSWFGSVGAVFGLNLDLNLGRFFFVGMKNLVFVPIDNRNRTKWTIYPGVHLGFTLGH